MSRDWRLKLTTLIGLSGRLFASSVPKKEFGPIRTILLPANTVNWLATPAIAAELNLGAIATFLFNLGECKIIAPEEQPYNFEMGNTGRPSKGCGICRARRVKVCFLNPPVA